ncbi:dynein regulatory complex protein 11 isoform X1 [Drosophila gunungcola]|uniref:dynein regulatory complex protein 11 isoform X1 n=2 Tax=Drosophila gunungcola TaxID=103775 RepID=UPI0022E98195|nr:dynein regulatory complex protein 11 isoform X1 [Drosophila gunungcola]
MSFDLNHKFWVSTRKEIGQLIKKQNRLKKIEPPQEKAVSFKIFAELYVLYVELVEKLGFIYHNTFQVQKRALVRVLVESATQQLMKLKEELKDLEMSEYIYIDKALIARKLTPRDLVIWRSPQFLYRRPLDIQNIIADNRLYMNEEEKEEKAAQDWVPVSEAVKLIQAHERARQARVYKSNIKYDKKKFLKVHQRKKINYKFTFKPDQAMSIPVKRTMFAADFLKPDESCENLRKKDDVAETAEDDEDAINRIRNNAACKIQCWWRGYRTRKIVKIRKRFKEELYGMKKIRKLKRPNQNANSIMEMYKKEMLKKKLDEDFINLINDERTRLLQVRSPWMMEDISDHIRDWFKEFYEKTENFHPYPDPVKKGTVLVVIDETMTPMEFQQTLGKKPMTKEEKKKLRDKEKKEKKKKKEKLKLIKMKEAKRRKKLRDAGIIDIGYELTASQPIEKIEETMKTYAKDWRNVDEYLNKNHDPIKEWVTEDELVKIHQEVRGLVDEYMRVEYELLREALAKDNNEKYKALKVKYPKKKKNRKKKKPKDMTGDRTLESLYHELKDGGIIEEVSHKDFDEFIADFNFVADDTRNEDDLTTWGPAKGDIKMVIQESMLGMGEFNIPKPKSLLLIGPLNSGKKLLCQIIASELDAVFMNLSPEKTYKYADDLKYFLHVVVKVARAFQPTIMFFDEAHRLFWKKIPPEAVNIKPRLLGPSIASKILKPLKKNDKIVVVGTSSMPWAAKGGIKRAFQKVLLIPKCDYGTSFLLWLELMTENAPDDMPEYAYSALARVLQAYNSGDINDNINQTLSIDRKMRLKNEALDPNEFLEYFISKNEPPILPPEEKLMVKFNKWFGKSNKLQKLRNSYIAQKLAKASKRK